MSKELAIGEIGVIDGVKVQCVKRRKKYGACGECALDIACSMVYESISPCSKEQRIDHTDVYFKKVE